MTKPTLFNFEAPVVQALQGIEGVLVLTAVDDTALENLSTVQPTVVLRWSTDNVVQANDVAALVEREVAVHLLIAGATAESEATDGELAYAVFDALHGLELPGHNAPLAYVAGGSDFAEGVREYLLTFKTQTTLRSSRG